MSKLRSIKAACFDCNYVFTVVTDRKYSYEILVDLDSADIYDTVDASCPDCGFTNYIAVEAFGGRN